MNDLEGGGMAGGAGPVAGHEASAHSPKAIYYVVNGWELALGPHSASRETEVALTMAAWGSFARHQREADRWLKLFEQRVARLSEPEREFVRRRTDRDLSP